ncbi:MAG: hypothetical protein IJ313_10400, partial [Clostridia bacterium]|nr:hypothetical protein [Clostridia bacterium]
MRKWNMMLLALLLVTMPAAGMAQAADLTQAADLVQELPELFAGVYEGISEGLNRGAQLAKNAAEQELTLSVRTDNERIEEGGTAMLEVTAGNPLPYETSVRFTLALPERIGMEGDMVWDAVLPAAQLNEETGEMEPSWTVAAREITLLEGGESAASEIGCEMAMGTRFYRASTPLQLCVPAVSVNAHTDGTQSGRLNPGDEFAYRLAVTNTGDAPKDMELEMTLPDAVMISGELPEGFVQEGQTIRGMIHAAASQAGSPFEAEIIFPAKITDDALEGDEDAQRLIAPVLRLDEEQVAAPRVQICGAKISARLMTECEMLETGRETTLSVVVVNSGLAEADVKLSCVLPDGLTLAQETEREEDEAEVVP